MANIVKLSPTPLGQVLDILSRPVGCGYKGCEDVIFGVQPLPMQARDAEGLYPMQQWERLLASHFDAAGHKQRRLREIIE